MILYRPVGLQELELIYDGGMRAFPARLPQQPIFYPVLDLEYARQTASKWNAKSGGSAGYVTQFKVEDQYIDQFEKHMVGSSQHQEFWIPAEELEEFNKHIVGHIKVLEAHFGDAFQGFVPEQFGLQGKNAVEQFTLLANSYLYKRMEFYLEIKRNHKAVFLNYPFWQTYEFKNPGLKEKIIKAIKEAWFTSFPKTPLPNPVPQELTSAQQADPQAFVGTVREDIPPVRKTNPQSFARPVHEDVKPARRINLPSLIDPVDDDPTSEEETDAQEPSLEKPIHEEFTPIRQTESHAWENPIEDDDTFEEQTDVEARSLEKPFHEEFTPVKRTTSQFLVHPVHEESRPLEPTVSHFSQGVELGLSGKIHEAIGELTKAVEEDSRHVAAHTSLGVAFHRAGEDDRAISCYETALKIDPDDAEAHYFRANILSAHGNVREAIAGYTIAVGLEPDLIEAHQKSVPPDRLTDYTGSPAEMHRIARSAQRILALNKSLETNPRQASLFKERAAEYYRLWNYERAIADYSSSLALQPDDANALHARGVAYEQLRQFERAQEDYRQAAVIDPQLSDEYINRGVTLGQTGNLRQSIASLNEGIRLAPRNPDGYFNRGTSYFQLGDLESAIADFSMVIQLAPKDEAAYYWRGISHEQAGHRDEAIADYKQFLALSRDPGAREEIEHKLSQWTEGKRDRASSQTMVPDDRPKTNQAPEEEPGQVLDLYDLIVALGERALRSTWFGSGLNCYGERAGELHALTAHNKPIQGDDLLQISSGIHQTKEGDFTAFDPDVTSHWLFIRAWYGGGFYIETNDPNIKEGLRTQFPSVQEVEGALPPYEGLFIGLIVA